MTESKKKYIAIIIVLLLLGIAARTYQFGTLMDSMTSDEMGSAYDAWSLINYGTDRYENSWPVYFNNYGRGQSAMYIYLMIPCIKLLGYGRFAIRFPALIGSILLAIFGLLTVGEIGHEVYNKSSLNAKNSNDRTSILQIAFIFLYAVAPYTIMASRFALDCNLMLGVSTMFLYFLIRAFNTKNNLWYLIAGVAAGLTLYTYAISYIVLPVMLILAIAYMIYTKRVTITNAILFVIPLAVLAFPLLLVQYVNILGKESFTLGTFTITKLSQYGGGEIGFKDFFPGIWQGLKCVLFADDIRYSSDPRFFTFYPMTIPFFAVGLIFLVKECVSSVRKRESNGQIFVLFWIIAEIIAAGLMTNPNVNRMNGIMFGVMYCAVLGFVEIVSYMHDKQKVLRNTFVVALAICYVAYFAFFIQSYYTEISFARLTDSSMCPEAFKYINNNDSMKNKVIATNIPAHLYPASCLPSPDKVDDEGNYHDELYSWINEAEGITTRDYLYSQGGLNQAYLIYRPTEDDFSLFKELGASSEKFGYNFYLWHWE